MSPVIELVKNCKIYNWKCDKVPFIYDMYWIFLALFIGPPQRFLITCSVQIDQKLGILRYRYRFYV